MPVLYSPGHWEFLQSTSHGILLLWLRTRGFLSFCSEFFRGYYLPISPRGAIIVQPKVFLIMAFRFSNHWWYNTSDFTLHFASIVLWIRLSCMECWKDFVAFYSPQWSLWAWHFWSLRTGVPVPSSVVAQGSCWGVGLIRNSGPASTNLDDWQMFYI